jgi:hypothetical protein
VNAFDSVGLETVEAAAIADAFGADAVQAGGVVCAVRPDLDEVYINRVIGLGVTEPASDAVLDRIAEVFGSVRHSIALTPCEQPADLPAMLRERGYEAGYAWVKFHRPAAAPLAAQTDLRVERIGRECSAEYVTVLAAGFGLLPDAAAMLEHLPGRPGCGCYLAYAGELLVAAGAVFVSGDHAWLDLAARRRDSLTPCEAPRS